MGEANNRAFQILHEMEEKLLTIEKRLDTKLESLSKNVINDFDKKQSCIAEIIDDNKIFDIRETIADFKEEVHKQITDIKNWQMQEDRDFEGSGAAIHENLREINELVANIRDYFTEMKTLIEQGKCIDIFTSSTNESEGSSECCTAKKKQKRRKKSSQTKFNEESEKSLICSPYLETRRKDSSSSTESSRKNVDILICMNSDKQMMQWRKMSPLQGTGRSFTGKLNELIDLVRDENKLGQLRQILVTIGQRDLEDKSSKQIFQEISDLVNELHARYREIMIIICEIKPRNEKDSVVQQINSLIHEHLGKSDHIFVMRPVYIVQPVLSSPKRPLKRPTNVYETD